MASNWLITESYERETTPNEVYQSTVFRRWGLVNVEGSNEATIQGVVYTRAAPAEYGDAYVVADCVVCEVSDAFGVAAGLNRRCFNRAHSFPCSLVFAFSPNVNYAPSSWRWRHSVERRTYNPGLGASYDLFYEAIFWSYFAVLATMATVGCDLAVLGPMTFGDTAGPHRVRIKSDLPKLITSLLHGTAGTTPFIYYFKRVILVLPPA